METSNFNKIIDFVKYVNKDNTTVQLYNYCKSKDTVLFLIEQINELCYDVKYKEIAIELYNILLSFLNKDISDDAFEIYFDKLYNTKINKLFAQYTSDCS